MTNSASDTHITPCLPFSNQVIKRQEIRSYEKRKAIEDIRDKPSKYLNKNKY